MTMTELFAEKYKPFIVGFTLTQVKKQIRNNGDRLDTKQLISYGVSQEEIKKEIEKKLIKYETSCGFSRRLSGYSLTDAGIKEIYNITNKK